MLELSSINKSYADPSGGTTPILDIPHFALAQGEQAVLVGKSGGGKTTLLHVIAGIVLPDSGKVTIGGVETSTLSESGRDRFRAKFLGYVFQTFNLLPSLTALENVKLGMTFGRSRMDPKRATELLQRVGLGERLHYKPSQLSVGQQQRVAIARALAAKPKLLLADEPTANVDPANQQLVIDLIRQTSRDEGISLLLVTHAMEIASQFDRVERLEQLNRVMAA
jgi:ABC-type lipoprotein export system ATPase subunit